MSQAAQMAKGRQAGSEASSVYIAAGDPSPIREDGVQQLAGKQKYRQDRPLVRHPRMWPPPLRVGLGSPAAISTNGMQQRSRLSPKLRPQPLDRRLDTLAAFEEIGP
jgi:hypothetical protein